MWSSQPILTIEKHPPATQQQQTRNETPDKNHDSEAALALYTWWLTAFTGLLAAATIGLGFATLLLYREAREQGRISKQAADAATKTADAAAGNAQMLLGIRRAHMSVKNYETGTVGRETVNGYLVNAIWANFGITPATNISSHIQKRSFPAETTDFVFVHKPTEQADGGKVGAGNGVKTGKVPISVDEAIAAWQGEKLLMIYTRVSYNDIFEATPKYIDEDCVEVKFMQDPRIRATDEITAPMLIGRHGFRMANQSDNQE